MGNIWTRILDEISTMPNHEPNTSKTSTHPATPIPTSRRFVLDEDPRSPNVECTRTPIVVECTENKTPEEPISSLEETPLSYLETDFENEPITKVRFVPQDPRSPTLGISRTPIQILSTPEQANVLKFVLLDKQLKFEDSENPSTEISDNATTPVKKIENENIATPSEKIKPRPKIVKTIHNKFNINDNKENPLEILKKKRNDNDENAYSGVTSSPRTPLGAMQPGAILRIKQRRDIKAAVGSSDSITGWDRDSSVLI